MSGPAIDASPALTFNQSSASIQQRRLSTGRQMWVLYRRFAAPSLLNGEVLTTVGAPIIFMVGFYIPFAIPWNQFVGGASSGVASHLGQYITPLVTLQAVSFAAIGSGFRAATDSLLGVNRRFQSMPMAPLTPLLARVWVAVDRCFTGLVISLVCGYVIGFRFHRGALYIVGFCLLVIAIGAVLSFAADLVGTVTRNPDAMLPLLSLPILIFGLLSIGLMPLKLFPHWIHPFVRNQPISQFVAALRALAGDTTKTASQVSWPVMAPTLTWLFAFVVILALSSTIVLARRP
ncbi:daunorubicin ABC transporter permease DrrB [Mycobacterium tuberculosis]|uniref:daunorubicin ABC transporter permease DrrB n=1 Tax=Mycobacterium tuberculosis TaxID=1773 RepID=UPI0005E92336|nr:daunorubicin ABC transporter permease DrrB [Mycobacterium tuberculosis]CKL67441.1 daunorubicin-DIM-transport integral membrane protein ABC transporter DRRB [Mycobacterium tuberculosis]